MVIYGIKLKENNKVIYVGQTVNLNRRINEHKCSYRGTKPAMPVHLFMRDYSFESFEFVVLEHVEKQKLLNEREAYWMGYYNTIEDGLNICTPDTTGIHNPNSRKIICTTDGMRFLSVTECAEYYGFKPSELSSHLSRRRYVNGMGIRTLGKPHFFEYADDIRPHKINPNKTQREQGVKIKCLNDGKLFDSIKKAAKAYGINYTSLVTAITNNEEYKSLKFIKV